MAIKTVVSWSGTPSDQEKIRLEIAKHVAAGETDESFEVTAKGMLVRSWTTVAAAQSWVDFLKGLDNPPTTAEVEQD